MIEIVGGDIFQSSCDAIVNPTNSVGVMGKGLAKEFIQRYAHECEHFNDYSVSFQQHRRSFGLLYPIPYWIGENKTLWMFPTKIHWKNPSKYEYILTNLMEMRENMTRHPQYLKQSIAFPALGCGNGGLDFKQVRTLIERHFADFEPKVEIYMP